MNLLRVFVMIGSMVPLQAQYGGPAILTRGEAPGGIRGAQVSFRPFINFMSVYDTGLAGVGAVDNEGNLGRDAAGGIEMTAGVSGAHRWPHSSLGLSYTGSARHYTKKTYYDGSDQSLNLGLTHQLSRRMQFTLRESVGMFSRGFGLLYLQQAVPFDPATSYIPNTDFFDNRTLYTSTQADFTYQRTARLSFNFGADYFTAKRRSAALFGVTGQSGRTDVQYRVARYTTIGGTYTFSRFSFSRAFGDSYLHSFAMTFSNRLSRNVELSAFGGMTQVETKYVQAVRLDPIVAAIIGQSQGIANVHRINNLPNVGGRIARTFRNSVVSLNGSHAVTPGNGLFLTSAVTSVSAIYSYNGLRRWSFSASSILTDAEAISNVTGKYRSYSGGLGLTRQLRRHFHLTARFDARQYDSPDFVRYDRLIYRGSVGLGFAPGEVPLRVW